MALRRVLIGLCAILGATAVGGAAAEITAPLRLRWGPYKDAAVPPPADPRALPRGATLTLAFATGECGAETIAGQPGADVARATVPPLEAAGVDFVVSTGGEKGRFTCASPQGMEDFLSHYRSVRLAGIDLDIEGERTAAELAALMNAVAVSQLRHPGLRWSLTLPTFAGTDAPRAGLNRVGVAALSAARASGVRAFAVNLMAMDYGKPSPAVCVQAQGGCDMARSALQAVENLHAAFRIPYNRIALTMMLGRNDTAGSVTELEDVRTVARLARARRLAGLYYWSLDRDKPCRDATPRSDCSGMPYPPMAYLHAIEEALAAP